MRDSGWTKGVGIVLMLVGGFSCTSSLGLAALMIGFVLFLSGRLAEG
jgi:hypothetical protein